MHVYLNVGFTKRVTIFTRESTVLICFTLAIRVTRSVKPRAGTGRVAVSREGFNVNRKPCRGTRARPRTDNYHGNYDVADGKGMELFPGPG